MILRRLLLFVLLLAVGSVVLVLATRDDPAFQSAARQKDVAPAPTDESAGPPGLMVKSQGRGSEGVPPGIEVRTGGPGKIGSSREVRQPGGKVWLVPEHEITWADATPRADGAYELAGVVLLLWPRIEQPVENPQPIVRLTAQSMTVVAAQKGGELIIDREHQMDLRGVVVTGTGTGSGAGTGRGGRVTLESARLHARVRKGFLELRTPDEREPVTLRGERDPGASRAEPMRILASGRGLNADLRSGSDQPAPDSVPCRSRITVLHDVVLRGVATANEEERFRIEGQGPLDLVEQADASWVCDLSGEARFRGRFSTRGGAASGQVLETSGESLRALIGQVRAGSALEAAASDLWLRGSAARRAEARVGGQRIRADLLEINLDANGDPEALTATGSPEVLLEDRTGKPLGRVACQGRATWRRPGLALWPIVQGWGIDLKRELMPLAAGPALLPEELIRLHGPARLEPAPGESQFRQAEASQGFLVALATRLGEPEPWLVLGFGEVAIGGEVDQQARSIAWTARGNRGLLLARDPISGRLRGCLGPSTAQASHEFVFTTETHEVRGRGLVLLDAEPAPKSAPKSASGQQRDAARFEVRFLAAVRQDLSLRLVEASAHTEIAGVKSARLVHAAGDLERIELGGTPVEVRGTRVGLLGRAEIVERIGDGPWLFRKVATPVEVELPGDARRGTVKLRAATVAVRLRARWPQGRDDRADLFVLASSDATTEVQVESRQPGDAVRLDLTCGRLVFLPWLLPPLAAALDGLALGGAGRELDASLAGGENGWFRAEGRVRVAVREVPEGGGAPRLHTFGGETLLLDAARAPVRCLLLPDAAGLVTATLEEPGRGVVRLLGDRLAVQGDEIVLGSGRGGSPLVYLVPDELSGRARAEAAALGGPRSALRALRVAAASAVRYDGRTLRFPGPVRADAVGDDDRHLPEDFTLTCQDELLVTLGAAKPSRSKPAEPGDWRSTRLALPGSVERVAARGDVRVAYAGVTARGDELGLDPATGWLDLERRPPGVVTVDLDGSWRMRTHERLSVNLVTREVRSGKGRIDGLLGALVR